MTLSYFTGEQHSENFDKILHLADELGYSVRVYESKISTQFDFLQAVYRDTATIVDATIPDDLSLLTVYPLLTAHINILDHILVFSDKQYEDGTQVLPLNITPQRVRTEKDKDLLGWLRAQLEDLKNHQYYERFEIESIGTLSSYKERMELVIVDSLALRERHHSNMTRVMISYRNSCSMEVEQLRKEVESQGGVEIKVLPPGSLCGDYEAHTPMRRWMLVGLLDEHIREVDEVWVYYNDIYANSWWTLAELVMVANINFERDENDKIKIKVYDAKSKRFLTENEYPRFVKVLLNPDQHRRLARLLSNTRPDTMGPENIDNINQLKQIVPIMRNMPKFLRNRLVKQMRPLLEQGIPTSIPKEQQEEMIKHLVKMYSDPDELERYVNDEMFQDVFWKNISYQTDEQTPALFNGIVNPDIFMDIPMREDTRLNEDELKDAVNNNTLITLTSSTGLKKYRVEKGITRYLWMATRMGQPKVKDAPGLEVIQTYNLSIYK